MSRLALLGGRYLLGLPIAQGGEAVEIDVKGVKVDALDFGEYVVLSRHGSDGYVTPDQIDHAANLRALRELGCSRVLAIGSVGSLHQELGVGTLVCPSDFIAFGSSPTTFGDERSHIVAAFDDGWRRHVRRAWKEWGEAELHEGGVYWQSAGPRLETRAEIRFIANVADLVGMTIASECTVACELHMHHAHDPQANDQHGFARFEAGSAQRLDHACGRLHQHPVEVGNLGGQLQGIALVSGADQEILGHAAGRDTGCPPGSALHVLAAPAVGSLLAACSSANARNLLRESTNNAITCSDLYRIVVGEPCTLRHTLFSAWIASTAIS